MQIPTNILLVISSFSDIPIALTIYKNVVYEHIDIQKCKKHYHDNLTEILRFTFI